MSCEHEFEKQSTYCTFSVWRGTCRKCGVWGWRGITENRKWRPYKDNPTEPREEWQGSNPTASPSGPIGGSTAIIMSDKNYNG